MFAVWREHKCERCGEVMECIVEGFIPVGDIEVPDEALLACGIHPTPQSSSDEGVIYLPANHSLSPKLHVGCGGELHPLDSERVVSF